MKQLKEQWEGNCLDVLTQVEAWAEEELDPESQESLK